MGVLEQTEHLRCILVVCRPFVLFVLLQARGFRENGLKHRGDFIKYLISLVRIALLRQSAENMQLQRLVNFEASILEVIVGRWLLTYDQLTVN